MFAAYARKNDEDKTSAEAEPNTGTKESDWLTNSSFTVNSEVISNIQGIAAGSRASLTTPKQIEKKVAESGSYSPLDSACTPPGSPAKSERQLSCHSPTTPPGSPSSSDSSDSSDIEYLGEKRVSRSRSPDQSKARGRSRKSRSRSYSRSSSDDRAQSKNQKGKRGRSRKSRSRSYSSSNSDDRAQSSSQRRKSKDRGRTTKRSRSRSRSSRGKHRRRSRSRDSKAGNHHEKEKRRRSTSCDSRARTQETRCMVNQEFYEDKTKSYGNLTVPTLSRPTVAWYRASRRGLGLIKHKSLPSVKRTLKHRYYNQIVKVLEADLMSLREKGSSDGQKVGQIQGNVNDVEEEISKVTAKFNQDLSENPLNVDIWRKYVQFQDVVHQFERVYRRGGGATGARVTSERKLAILDKAIKANPLCEQLLKERCQLAESVLPLDKLTSELKTKIGTDPGNLVLWEALIMASQGSLSSCKAPAVKSLYQEALKNIHSLRRGNTESAKTVEAKLIDLVLHLGLFFRQSGLLELMWSLISIYLEFNLAKLDPNKFHITNTVADNALTELEEAILASQMPLSTLWLRIETLRAGTHWVPLPADADSEDPQRLVFPEDVNDLIHPINCPQLSFRLVSVTLSLLKVPLLPWRECAARAVGLHPLPWLLDGPEMLYASLLPLGTVEFKETSALLIDASQLVCGPQYLIARPGQDEYIDFLAQVFSACSDCLSSNQRTYLLVWWLRFYRWLMQLDRLGHCKLPKGRKKKMRTAAKDLLRQDANRSNYLLFREFALLELENGSVDGAKKVLQGTLSALPLSKPTPNTEDKASICSLYRTLVEVHLSNSHNSNSDLGQKAENQKHALSLLVSLGRGTPIKNEKPSSTDIAAAISKFNQTTRETIDNPTDEELDPFIAPDVCHVAPTFLVEWTACHCWLLFLSTSIWKAAAVFENVLSEIRVLPSESSESSNDPSCSAGDNFTMVQRESLFEAYLSLLRHHCFETRGSYAVLREVLLRGLKEFPGNLTFAASLADLETSTSGTGLPLWRLSKVFYELNAAPAYALFVFVTRYRLKQQESAARSAQSLLGSGGPELPDPNTRNRMATLLKKLTKHPVMRRCPLLWRLRLQFAAAVNSNDADCCSTFYMALEDCPWVKALYMDIVQVLPTQLAQVQDLLVEKELRLHITPEELQILRIDQ